MLQRAGVPLPGWFTTPCTLFAREKREEAVYGEQCNWMVRQLFIKGTPSLAFFYDHKRLDEEVHAAFENTSLPGARTLARTSCLWIVQLLQSVFQRVCVSLHWGHQSGQPINCRKWVYFQNGTLWILQAFSLGRRLVRNGRLLCRHWGKSSSRSLHNTVVYVG